MRFSRLLSGLLPLVTAASLSAQGTTTGALTGSVMTAQGQAVEAAQVQVTNIHTGFTVGVNTTAAGRYYVAGLEVGPGYRVTARRIGFRPLVKNDVTIALGEARRLDFTLEQQAAALGEITVSAAQDEVIAPNRTGTQTTVSDSALRRLPSLNRNFTDFVALTPQVSTTLFNGGLSGGGTNNRFNNVQIDGTSEADVFGLGSTGQPGGQASGKSIGLEAVKEYKVLLSPFDVRQGFFAGLSINAVTKSGTNEFSGSAFAVSRTDNQTRKQPFITDYKQQQYGFSVGGPIIKDRAFFFLSPEFQARETPAGGGYFGQSTVSLTQQQVDSFTTAVGNIPGLNNTGNFGRVTNNNPLTNIFARVDVNLPFNTQLVLRHNYGHAEDDVFSRSTGSFKLSNNAYYFNSVKHAPAMQLRTLFTNGAYNEIMAGYTRIRDKRTPVVVAPEVVAVISGFSLVAGSERASHGNELDQDILEVTENFTYPYGSHRFTVGTQNQFMKFRNLFANNRFGVWEFGSIDSMINRIPRTFQVGVPLVNNGGTVAPGGDGAVRFGTAIYSGYLQDEWTINPKLNVSVGVRADVPVFKDVPPTNTGFQTAYGRNTADLPSGNIQWSPRVGFNYDITGDAKNQVRGGVGLFTGRPAYVWLSNSFQNSGMGAVANLSCTGTTATAANRPPAFNNANIATPPTACGGGTTAALGAEIDLLDPNFKHPQNLRGTLAYDRRLFSNWIASAEVLYTKGVNGVFYQNIALAAPQGKNAVEGRTIYGTAAGTAAPTPVLKPQVNGTTCSPTLNAGCRTQIFEASNQSEDNAYSLTGGVQRRYMNNFEGSLFYTYTQAQDVQSFTSSTAFSQYRFGRVWGGDQSEKTPTRSTFEQTHRFVGTFMYSLPTKTDINIIWFGESGSPYTYVTSGDLNGDGITSNDPIYVPNNAMNTAEMIFTTATFGGVVYTPAQQAQAFENYINGEDCLKEARGKLIERNTCTNPFRNTVNLSFRQSFKTYRLQHITLEAGIFNFLNLVNKNWGWRQSIGTSPISILNTGTGYVNGTGNSMLTGQPTYTFNPTFVRYLSNNLDSNYQIQVQAKYAF